MLQALIDYAGALTLSFVPGYFALQAILPRGSRWPAWGWSASFTLGLLVLAAIQGVSFAHASPASMSADNLTSLAVVVAALFALGRRRGAPAAPRTWWPLICFALFVALGVVGLGFVPNYMTAHMGDWANYHPNTHVYLREVTVADYLRHPVEQVEVTRHQYLFKRTPLFSLLLSFFGSVLGRGYPSSQVFATVCNGLVFWSVFELGRWGGRRAGARWCLLTLPWVPAVSHAVAIPVPKLLTAFLLLTAAGHGLRFLVGARAGDARHGALFAVFAVTAYLAHPSAALFAMWGFLGCLLGWRRLGSRAAIPLAWGAGAGVLLVLPWGAWLVQLLGVAEALTPVSTVQAPSGLGRYALSRLTMMGTSLGPTTLLWTPGVGWGDAILRVYWETFAGALGVVGGSALAVALWTSPRPPLALRLRLLSLALVLGSGGALAVCVVVDNSGNAVNLFAPLLVFLLTLTWLAHARLPAHLRRAAIVALALEGLAVRALEVRVAWQAEARVGPGGFEHLQDAVGGPLAQACLLAIGAALYAAFAWALTRWLPPCPHEQVGSG